MLQLATVGSSSSLYITSHYDGTHLLARVHILVTSWLVLAVLILLLLYSYLFSVVHELGHFLLQLPSEILCVSVDTRWHSGVGCFNTEWLVIGLCVCTHTRPAVSSTQCVCTHTTPVVSSISLCAHTLCWARSPTCGLIHKRGLVIGSGGAHTLMIVIINCVGPHPKNRWHHYFLGNPWVTV